MKWEHCIRCGSNRVGERFFIGRGVRIILISFLIGIITSVFHDSIVADIIGSIVIYLPIYGIVVIFKSKRLVCKDCEISWKPNK
jgi:hypothetical protein